MLAGLRVLVLDEAGQLLDRGFRPAIEKILAQLPIRLRFEMHEPLRRVGHRLRARLLSMLW